MVSIGSAVNETMGPQHSQHATFERKKNAILYAPYRDLTHSRNTFFHRWHEKSL